MGQILVGGGGGGGGDRDGGSLEIVLCFEFLPRELEAINQPATYNVSAEAGK